jgi:hypothetical protein
MYIRELTGLALGDGFGSGVLIGAISANAVSEPINKASKMPSAFFIVGLQNLMYFDQTAL